MFVTFLKFLVVLFSIWSFSIFFRKKFELKLEFGFLITTACIISILYLASLANLLMPAAIIILAAGVILGVYFLFKCRVSLFKENITESTVIGFLLLTFLFISLQEIKALHFDNFSHWLLIAKQTLEFNQLPDASNILTNYYEYPPGSTYFIYYCCLILGDSEFCLLISQALLEIILLLPIFTFVKDNSKKTISIILILFIVFCLVIDISVGDLLVDSLLGIAALSSFMFLYFYKGNLKKALLFLIPINLMLLLIKNSAIFFYTIELIYILYLCLKCEEKIKNKIIYLLITLIPFVLFILWKIRCKIIFSGFIGAAQSISLSNYESNLSLKTVSDITQIIKTFLNNLIDIHNLYLIIIILCLLGIIIYYFKNKNNFSLKKVFSISCLTLSIYLLYTLSLLFAYIVSMTLDEALRLACFNRYVFSVIIFIVGLLICLYVDKGKQNILLNIFIILSLLFAILVSKNTLTLIGIQDYKNTTRYKVEQNFKSLKAEKTDRILVIASSSKTDGYVTLLITYLLNTKNYDLVQDTASLSKYKIEKYDYVITLDKDNNVTNFLKPLSSYNGKTGTYKVK